jgi:hypothetical protein
MTEITLVMDFGRFTRNEGVKPGTANPQHFPDIRFAFQLCCFREFGALAKE